MLKYKKNNFYLNFALCKNYSEKFNTDFPFQVLDNSGKFARIIRGEIRLNKISKVKKLLLLVQRDNYLFEYNDLIPVTNGMLDKRWHHLISADTNSSAFHFTISEKYPEEPFLFQSLFYCQKTRHYFHPLCPVCASELELCMDDKLLKKNALPFYSNSLKRYLYCPNCITSSDQTQFYTYSKNISDPGYVKNRFDLIHDFKNIKVNADHFFPCHTCKEHMNCYMSGNKADKRISFFSFYPFYMMCFDHSDMTMEAFLPLISGAGIDEIDMLKDYGIALPDKQKLMKYNSKQAFFFHDSPMFFFEVIYLKLSLLRETARSIFIKSNQSKLYEFELPFKKIWIKLNDQKSVLPYLWNFSVNILDIPDKKDEQQLLNNNNFSSYFASLWLYVFFVNKNQRSIDIYPAVSKIVKELNKSGQNSIDVINLFNSNKAFQSHQIFWNNPSFNIHSDHLNLWNKIVKLFFSFFPGNNTEQDINNVNSIINDIDFIIDDIKEKLFNQKQIIIKSDNSQEKKTTNLQKKELTELSNHKIFNILNKIKKKWENETIDYDNDIMETVPLLTSDKKVNKLFENKYNLHCIIPDTCNNGLIPKDTEETAICENTPDKTQTQIKQETTKSLSGKETGFGSDLEKTVILSTDNLSVSPEYNKKTIDTVQNDPVITSKKKKSVADNHFSDKDQDMEKTVIVIPDKSDNKSKRLK